jgi:hypothetical protein
MVDTDDPGVIFVRVWHEQALDHQLDVTASHLPIVEIPVSPVHSFFLVACRKAGTTLIPKPLTYFSRPYSRLRLQQD